MVFCVNQINREIWPCACDGGDHDGDDGDDGDEGDVDTDGDASEKDNENFGSACVVGQLSLPSRECKIYQLRLSLASVNTLGVSSTVTTPHVSTLSITAPPHPPHGTEGTSVQMLAWEPIREGLRILHMELGESVSIGDTLVK